MCQLTARMYNLLCCCLTQFCDPLLSLFRGRFLLNLFICIHIIFSPSFPFIYSCIRIYRINIEAYHSAQLLILILHMILHTTFRIFSFHAQQHFITSRTSRGGHSVHMSCSHSLVVIFLIYLTDFLL